MPRTVKTLDPHKAKTRVYARKGVKPRFEVGETYLYKRQRMDGKGEVRTLVTVIDRKQKGKSVTIAVIAVTSHKPHDPKVERFRPDETEMIRGIPVKDTEEGCVTYRHHRPEYVEWSWHTAWGRDRYLLANAKVKSL
jgi:hypothetical protein